MNRAQPSAISTSSPASFSSWTRLPVPGRQTTRSPSCTPASASAWRIPPNTMDRISAVEPAGTAARLRSGRGAEGRSITSLILVWFTETKNARCPGVFARMDYGCRAVDSHVRQQARWRGSGRRRATRQTLLTVLQEYSRHPCGTRFAESNSGRLHGFSARPGGRPLDDRHSRTGSNNGETRVTARITGRSAYLRVPRCATILAGLAGGWPARCAGPGFRTPGRTGDSRTRTVGSVRARAG